MSIVLNPVGYRIGYLNSWSDAWYVHRIYYPAFLHNTLLIKYIISHLATINAKNYYFLFFKKHAKWNYFINQLAVTRRAAPGSDQ